MKHARFEAAEVQERMINEFDQAMLELAYLEGEVRDQCDLIEALIK